MANENEGKPVNPTPVVSLDAARTQAAAERRAAEAAAAQPMIRLPPTVKILCAVLLACFAAQKLLPADIVDILMFQGSFIPARYSGVLPFDAAALWSPLTYALLHGGWLHLGINTGMLMAFGAGIEKQRGGRMLAIVFIGGTLGGALAQFLLDPASTTPMIGASGGISGLFGAALMEMAHQGAGHGASFFRRLRHLLPFIAVWVLISIFFGIFGMPGEDQPVAWAAHIGGFAAGLLLNRAGLRTL